MRLGGVVLLMALGCGPAAAGPPAPPCDAVEVLPDAAFLPRLLDDLGHARRTIRLATYLFRIGDRSSGGSDEVLRALLEAAARGVEVTVILEREDAGDERGTLGQDNLEAARRLNRGGVRVFFTAPVLTPRGRVLSVRKARPARHRTLHAKMVRIDSDRTYVGSHNLTLSALRWNHEVTLRVQSRGIAASLDAYLDGLLAREGAPYPLPLEGEP